MEPSGRDTLISELAIWDPIAAYGILLGIPRAPFAMNASAIFSSFTLPQNPVSGKLDTTIDQRTWIDNMSLAPYQPNVFKGNVFKTLYDTMLKSAPGVSARVAVYSGPRYVLSPEFTPIENLVNQFSSRWPKGWILYKEQSIKVDFQLTQAPPSDSPNAPPYNITLTFNGWQFLDPTLDNIGVDTAAAELRKAGFVVPSVGCVSQGPGDRPPLPCK